MRDLGIYWRSDPVFPHVLQLGPPPLTIHRTRKHVTRQRTSSVRDVLQPEVRPSTPTSNQGCFSSMSPGVKQQHSGKFTGRHLETITRKPDEPEGYFMP